MNEDLRNLYLLTSKLIGNEHATAFLIDKHYVITARHAVKENIKNNSSVDLIFYIDGGRETITVNAQVEFDNVECDIAILKVSENIDHINNWIELCDYDIKEEDKWETVGFPVGWDEAKEGSKFCYIKGEVYQNAKFDYSTKYDIHLASKYIKEEWKRSLRGLSGAAMLSNGKIVGIILDEEYSAINAPLKVISIKKIRKFLEGCNIKVQNCEDEIEKQWKSNNLLGKRMLLQEITCKELFHKVDYSKSHMDLSININPYFIRYNADGSQKIKNLAQYIARALTQYACSLVEINKMIEDPMDYLMIHQKVEECIIKIKNNNMLGRVILWMIIEGVIGAPKTFMRLPSNNEKEYQITEVHISTNEQDKLILHLGDSKIRENLLQSVEDVVKSLLNDITIKDGIINIKDDIYIPDNYVYDNLQPSPLKDQLGNFMIPNKRNWDNVNCELTVFTGYNSTIYKMIEKLKLSNDEKEDYLEQIFRKDCIDNEKYIVDIVGKYSAIKELKINWFVLPFDKTDSFEELVLTEIRGEC